MLRHRLFELLSVLAARHGVAVIAIATVLTVVSLGLATRIELKTNFKDALGPEHPIAKQQVYLEENFASAYTVQVVLEGGDRDRLVEVARDVEARLATEPEVRTVYLEQPVDFFVRHGLLYMEVADLQALEGALAKWEEPLRKILRDPSLFGLFDLLGAVGEREQKRSFSLQSALTRAIAEAPPGRDALELLGVAVPPKPKETPLDEVWSVVRDAPLPMSDAEARAQVARANEILGLVADVLDRGELITPEDFGARVQRLRDLDYAALGDAGQRYRFGNQGGMLVMDVSATRNVARLDQAIPFVDTLRRVVDDVGTDHGDVALSLTGLPVMLIEEQGAILDNFLLVTLLGFVGVLAVFVIGFERVGLPSLAALPLVMGTAWTFGVQALVYGEMNLFTMAFPVLLFGVGVDFAIHQLAGYAEQRGHGHEPEEALRRMYAKTGDGLLTGGLTTAAAFLAMLGGQSYGMRSMGFTAGVGIFMALAAMLTVLPALVVLYDRRIGKRGDLVPNVPFTAFEPMGAWLRRFRYPVLAGFLVATIAAAYVGADVGMNQNYIESMPQDLESLKTQARVVDAFGEASEVVTVFADDLAHAERIRVSAEAAGTVASVFSADLLVPRDQATKRPHVEAIARRLDAVASTGEPPAHAYDDAELDRLKDAIGKLKLAALDASLLSGQLYSRETQDEVGALRDVLNRIDARLVPASAERFRYLDGLLAAEIGESFGILREMGTHVEVGEEDLPASIEDRLRGKDGRWMVLVKARGDVWNQEYRATFLRDLDAIGAEYSGLVPAAHEMMASTVADAPRLTALIFGIVALLVLIDLRSVKATLLAMVPLAVGLLWTLGIMGILGQQFNAISMVSLPLVVGIGIDDGVHVYHRIRKEGALGPALAHAGKACILTSLTTGIGFGSLMLSIHPGFFSLGFVVTAGVASCLLLSLFLLPALVAIFDEDSLAAPAPPPSPESP